MVIEIDDMEDDYGHVLQSQGTMQSHTSIKKVETFRENLVKKKQSILSKEYLSVGRQSIHPPFKYGTQVWNDNKNVIDDENSSHSSFRTDADFDLYFKDEKEENKHVNIESVQLLPLENKLKSVKEFNKFEKQQ